MKFKNNLFGIAAMALCLGLASCSDDDELQFSQAQVTNSELKTILEQNGLHFDEQGHLLLDEAANNLKALNLSGKKISDYKELAVLPNLTELNLSNNEFGPTFDFGILPSQIKVLDLTGNEIYEVANLADINEQTGAVTLKLDFDKLILPETAKYDCYELPQYFLTDKQVDMKLGTEVYSNLRAVPDPGTLFILKKLYPSMFEGDKIDISRRLVKPLEKAANLEVNIVSLPNEEGEIKSVEGAEYIALNKGFEGGSITLSATEECELPYFKVGPTVSALSISRISTAELDLSEAENLVSLGLVKNHGVTTADLSASKLFGQREYKMENGSMKNPSKIQIKFCDNLKSIVLPENARIVNTIQVGELKNLESFDMSKLNAVSILQLVTMPKCKIGYPTYQFDLRPEGYLQWTFGCEEDIYDKPETKAMLDKYHDGLKRDGVIWFGGSHFLGYNWKSQYNK